MTVCAGVHSSVGRRSGCRSTGVSGDDCLCSGGICLSFHVSSHRGPAPSRVRREWLSSTSLWVIEEVYTCPVVFTRTRSGTEDPRREVFRPSPWFLYSFPLQW